MSKNSLLFFTLLLVSFATLCSEDAEKFRRVSMDSQYFTLSEKHSVPSNRAIGDFTVEFLSATGLLFDKVGEWTHADSSAWSRLPYLLVFGAGIFTYFQEPLNLAYHEMGHASRFRAMGAKPVYFYNGSSKTYSNFFSFALAGMGKEIGNAQVTLGNERIFKLSDPAYQLIGSMGELRNPIYLMGGLNNEMYLTELLEERTYHQKGHVMETASYVASKLSAYFYVEDMPTVGDTTGIKTYFAGKNINVNDDDLTGASELSLLLSSTTYAYLYGMYNYVTTGKSTVEHFSYKGVRLPDLSFYMTRRGLSYKLNTGYEFSNQKSWLILGFEKVFEGEDASEITLGWRQNFTIKGKQLNAKLLTMVGPSLSTTLESSFNVAKSFWVTLGTSEFNVHSLWGERHIASLQGDDVDYDFWGKLSYYY